MNLDERNAARYLVTAENLEALGSEPLVSARAAAAQEDRAQVKQFVDAVQRLISSEHQEWILLKNYTGNPNVLVDLALDPGSIEAPTARADGG